VTEETPSFTPPFHSSSPSRKTGPPEITGSRPRCVREVLQRRTALERDKGGASANTCGLQANFDKHHFQARVILRAIVRAFSDASFARRYRYTLGRTRRMIPTKHALTSARTRVVHARSVGNYTGHRVGSGGFLFSLIFFPPCSSGEKHRRIRIAGGTEPRKQRRTQSRRFIAAHGRGTDLKILIARGNTRGTRKRGGDVRTRITRA